MSGWVLQTDTTTMLISDIAPDPQSRAGQSASLHHLDARLEHLFCLDLHSGGSCEHHYPHAPKSRGSLLPQLRTKSMARNAAHIRPVGHGRPDEHVRMVPDTLARDTGRPFAHCAIRSFCGYVGDPCTNAQCRLCLSQVSELNGIEQQIRLL
jgi:hypothetical protein